MSNDPVVSVILPCHSETKWLTRAARSVFTQINPPKYELIVVIDKAAGDTTQAVVDLIGEAPAGVRVQPITIDTGDLGPARNVGVKMARGRFVSFIDADDAMGCTFLRTMFEHARRYDHDDFILHHRWSCMFSAASFWHYHVGSDDPCFSPKDTIQYNPASALAFGPKSVFERFPYRPANDTWGWEDWTHYTETLGAGVEHPCVDGTVFFVRMKLNESSMATRMTGKKLALRPMPLFDRRDLPDARMAVQPQQPGPDILKQALFVHHRVGEYRVMLDPGQQTRTYPRQKIFDDQAWLRDQIGQDKHVVLVHEIKPGGAEKYALDWADALAVSGEHATIIETAPGASPWLERAKSNPALKVVQWHKRNDLQGPEVPYALQRALIQCELESLFVCNSELGWSLVQEHPTALAKRVIAASFSVAPWPTGYVSCPPFYMDKQAPNVTILTDNELHAARLRDYGSSRVVVVQPRCNYRGPDKLRQSKDGRLRLLWAGRGSPEKAPHIASGVAQMMPDVDVHIWGDVQPIPHRLENLHYRGPFDSFEAIDGAYDAYLLTSLFEGMPNTALEAVAAGLPVISSNVGDVRKIAAAVFPSPTGADQVKNVTLACQAIAEFVKARDKYDHTAPRALVEEWRKAFPAAVRSLVTG
jgi:glycosyltransferase involved in cell wall biosynthesis